MPDERDLKRPDDDDKRPDDEADGSARVYNTQNYFASQFDEEEPTAPEAPTEQPTSANAPGHTADYVANEFEYAFDDEEPTDAPPGPTANYLASELHDELEAGPQNTSDYLAAQFSQTGSLTDDETDEMPPVTDEQIAAARTPKPRPPAPDVHDLPTMPPPLEQNPTSSNDPRQTLAGSGGLDPNPDFSSSEAHRGEYTVPHIVPFQHTMVHVPPERGTPPAQTVPAPPYQPRQAPPAPRQQNTLPNQGYTVPGGQGPAQGQYPPQYVQPGAPVPGQGKLPARKSARKRKILGCSPGCFMVFVGVFVTFCGGLSLITLLLSATLGSRLEEQLQTQVASIDDYRNFESTFFYDRTGELLYEAFSEGRRTNVEYEQFPVDLINATVAIEDDSFWSNPGFELQATGRAFLQYLGSPGDATGGSTITQQLVRNVLFDYAYRSERSPQRKIEEILLSVLLTQRRSKPEILALYLNEIYYGNLAYGAQAASQALFGKDVGQLTLGEAALLAGLPQAPANLDPLNPDPDVQEAVNDRWRQVLDRMVIRNYITDAQRNEALSLGLAYNPPDAPMLAPHFTVYAQQAFAELMGRLGYLPNDVTRGGWQIYTTLDLDMNNMAQQAAASQVAALAGNNVSNAAVLVTKPQTGEILAMVGSVDYDNDAIDGQVNVTVAQRQPGSTMKPFTYSSAMELGFTPADVIWDTPTDIAGYRPVNYDSAFHGPVRLRTALANSYNIPAVQTLRLVGVENLLAFMQRVGVESLGMDASQFGLSLTLGGGEITLLELTRGYSVFANGGVLVPTTAILCVLDGEDNIVYEYEGGCPKGNRSDQTHSEAGYGTQVLDPRIAYIISDVLADNNARSAAMGANSPLRTDIGASVKTGTTNDIKDNWTVGYTRNVAVGVWVGNSRGEAMVNSSGLTGAAPIWNSVITSIYNNPDMRNTLAVEGQLQPDRADPPQGMSRQTLCDLNALRDPATDCAGTVSEWLLDGPAGLPDGNGGLIFPAQQAGPDGNPPQTGPWLQEIQPDIYRVLAQPIPPEIGAQIQFQQVSGQAAPPAPIYCQVPIEAASMAPAARDQIFIGPPPDAADAAQAETWARGNGLAFLPTIACDAGLLSLSPGAGGPIVITAQIQSPTPGQVVSGETPVIGTVQFSPDQALYYKVEISGGQFGGNWVTVGDTHSNSVVNGQLEYLAALPPENYQVRLVVVGHDGNFVQPPYTVAFTAQ